MLNKHTNKKLTWIDLESPTRDEVRSLLEEYSIHPLVANELLSPTMRPRVDVYDNFIYLILYFPTVIHSHGKKQDQEIDFIIGKDFIITVHYEAVDVLNEFSKMFDMNSFFTKDNITTHAGFIFFYMVRHLYHNVNNELDYIGKELGEIENRIFEGQEHEMVKEISKVSRQLLNFKKAMRPHREILESFELAGKKLFGGDFEYYPRAILGEYYKISVTMDSNIDTLNELRVTNDSLLSTKMNDVMKILTIMAFITFPLSLFASIFGMNTEYLPIVGQSNDFWIIIGIMVAATIIFFGFFKYKKWF